MTFFIMLFSIKYLFIFFLQKLEQAEKNIYFTFRSEKKSDWRKEHIFSRVQNLKLSYIYLKMSMLLILFKNTLLIYFSLNKYVDKHMF